MPQFLKKIRRETIFAIIGVLFAIIIVTVVVYTVNFLATEIKISLEETGADTQRVTRFNLEGLKGLGLIKENKEQPASESVATTTPIQAATTTEVGTTTTSKPKR